MRIGPYRMSAVYTGDARELAQAIPDASVDMIFTDPPYLRQYLDLYGWLADTAARVLKPGGFCLAMAGGLYSNVIMSSMAAHLTYYWTFHVQLTGSQTGKVHPGGNAKPIITRVKPIYAFVKDWGMPRTVMYDPFAGAGNEKQYHHWGQDAQSARYYVDCLTERRDVVLDPFCGGGTTPHVCKALGRRFLAFEIDPAAAEVARGRIRNEAYTPQVNGQMVLDFAR